MLAGHVTPSRCRLSDRRGVVAGTRSGEGIGLSFDQEASPTLKEGEAQDMTYSRISGDEA